MPGNPSISKQINLRMCAVEDFEGVGARHIWDSLEKEGLVNFIMCINSMDEITLMNNMKFP